MDIKNILMDLSVGNISIEDAYNYLKDLPFKRLDNGVCIDSHREIRTGHGEIIFGKGKSIEQLETILSSSGADKILVTKLDKEIGEKLEKFFSKGKYYSSPKSFVLGKKISLDPPWQQEGDVIVITAGASDLPIALEAYLCAKFF